MSIDEHLLEIVAGLFACSLLVKGCQSCDLSWPDAPPEPIVAHPAEYVPEPAMNESPPVEVRRTALKRKAKKHPAFRHIGGERVPWDHTPSDHDWDEFEHSRDECEPME